VNAPSRRDRLRPVELLVMSAIMAAFVGLVVLMSTREWMLAGIFAGVAFIVVLVVIAMFALTFKPNENEQHEIDDDDSQRPTGH
jgi:fatty acid desaturase